MTTASKPAGAMHDPGGERYAPLTLGGGSIRDFVEQTRVTGEGGSFRAELSAEWDAFGRPLGGYVGAIALIAAARDAADAAPYSFTAHFLRPATFGPVDIHVEPAASGAFAEARAVTVTQDGTEVLRGVAWFHRVGSGPHVQPAPADVPAPETIPSSMERYGITERPPGWRWNFDEHVTTWHDDWFNRPGGVAEFGAWYRFAPTPELMEPAVRAARLVVLADFCPVLAITNALPGDELSYRYVTLSLHVAFHTDDLGSEFVHCQAEAPLASGGTASGTARLTTPEGRWIASGTAQMSVRPFNDDDDATNQVDAVRRRVDDGIRG